MPVSRWMFFLVLGSWCMGYVAFVYHSQSYPHEVPKCEYIAVLTGDRGRIALALATMKKTNPKGVFVSGVYEKTTLNDILSHEQYSGCYVVLGKCARNTEENASEICDWARDCGANSFVLITSDYHMIRSLTEIAHYDPALEITPVAVATQSKIKFFCRCFQEFNRTLLVYIKRYGRCF